MVENLPLQVAEVWCWGPVTLCNFLSNLSRNGWKFAVASCRGLVLRPCYTVQFSQQLVSQCSSERKTIIIIIIIIIVCACARVKTAVKLRDKLLEGWYTVQWCCQLLQSVAKSRAEFYFVQRFAQQKKLRDNPSYTVQFSSNLSRNAIARQVAEKIAQCNRALRSTKLRINFLGVFPWFLLALWSITDF